MKRKATIKKLNKANVLNLIKEEAQFILKKEEYHNKICKLNSEIKSLYENREFAGTFGFEGDGSSVSGFVDTPNISYLAQLEKDFAEQDARDEELDVESKGEEINLDPRELEELKKENQELKEKLEEISAFIETMKKADSK
jgi:hypothetical protein